MNFGDPSSPVRIIPEWRGAPAPDEAVEIASAHGVDLSPLDVHDPATCERLMAYVFADQPKRSRRLGDALDLARQHPPRVDRADAATWLADRLMQPQAFGRCRVVFHSMVLQYLDASERDCIVTTLAAAGARADPDRPLAWIGFEWTPRRTAVELRLTCWPGGDTRVLALSPLWRVDRLERRAARMTRPASLTPFHTITSGRPSCSRC